MIEEDMEEEQQEERVRTFWQLLRVPIFFGLSLGFSFLIGSWWSCNNGGGILDGTACIQVREVGLCEFQGKQYIVPERESIDDPYAVVGWVNSSPRIGLG